MSLQKIPPQYRADFIGHAIGTLMLLVLLGVVPTSLRAQDWFKTGTGLGVSRPKVAVADLAPRSTDAQAMATLFTEVVRNDLDFSGILDLASKSFYPTQVPTTPTELNDKVWTDPPVSAQFLAFGNLTAAGSD